MVSKKLTNVGDGTDPNDAGSGDITKNIDLKDTYNVINSKINTYQELTAESQTLVNFDVVRENLVGINEAFPMKNYLDMGTNFIYNVKTPINNDQGANKRYVDSAITADYQKKANIDFPNTYNVNNSKKRTALSLSSNKNTLISLAEGEEHFVNINNDTKMWAKIDMNNYQINNLPLPTGQKQPTTLAFPDNKYVHRDLTAAMLNDLNMNNKKIIHLRQPTDDTDAANKKYVDDNKVDVSNYLKVDGTNKMTGDLNVDKQNNKPERWTNNRN